MQDQLEYTSLLQRHSFLCHPSLPLHLDDSCCRSLKIGLSFIGVILVVFIPFAQVLTWLLISSPCTTCFYSQLLFELGICLESLMIQFGWSYLAGSSTDVGVVFQYCASSAVLKVITTRGDVMFFSFHHDVVSLDWQRMLMITFMGRDFFVWFGWWGSLLEIIMSLAWSWTISDFGACTCSFATYWAWSTSDSSWHRKDRPERQYRQSVELYSSCQLSLLSSDSVQTFAGIKIQLHSSYYSITCNYTHWMIIDGSLM